MNLGVTIPQPMVRRLKDIADIERIDLNELVTNIFAQYLVFRRDDFRTAPAPLGPTAGDTFSRIYRPH